MIPGLLMDAFNDIDLPIVRPVITECPAIQKSAVFSLQIRDGTYKAGHVPQPPGMCCRSRMNNPRVKRCLLSNLTLARPFGAWFVLSTPTYTSFEPVLMRPLCCAEFRSIYSTKPFVGSFPCSFISTARNISRTRKDKPYRSQKNRRNY